MKRVQKPIRTMASLAVIAMMAHQGTYAGGFSLYTESSAAAIGNYAAGIAAEGADASIGWYNPAGLVLLKKQQVLLGGVGVFPQSTLNGTSTFSTEGVPLPFSPYTQSINDLQGAKSALIPSLHYALPLGDRMAFGLSFVSPFGLSTDYAANSPVRYSATLSKFETFLASPEIAGQLTDYFSVGLGLDLEYARVSFNSVIGSPALMQFLDYGGSPATPYTLDSTSNNSGDSFGIGFHVGAMFMFDDHHTRVGVNYQSGVNHQFNGNSQLTGPLADPNLYLADPSAADPNAKFISNALYSNSIKLPEIVTLSAYRDINQKFALLGSVVYSGWSSFKAITLNNVAVGVPNGLNTPGTIQTTLNATTNENYRDAWRFALGANYRVTDQWMMRVGGGYDQTPTVNGARDVRLPDSDRWALSIGTHYQVIPSVGIDAGYTYLFAANDASINTAKQLSTVSTYNVNATSKNSAQLVGLQVVWTIDQVKGAVSK